MQSHLNRSVLNRVFLLDGSEEWILVDIEFQEHPDVWVLQTHPQSSDGPVKVYQGNSVGVV
jgi:hypothetical protein